MELLFKKRARLRSIRISGKILLALLPLIHLVSGCSTKKNTFTRRAYHNLNSHYNVYFNGNESLKTGVFELRKIVQDDYSKVLLVNNLGKKSDAQKQNTHNDRAIQKSAITIQRHSMIFGGNEKVKWIKDAYLLMGKAHFFKQDYTSARRTFDFVNTQYKTSEIAYTAQMWLANTYVQTKQYEKAEPLFQTLFALSNENEMSSEVSQNLHFYYADFMILIGKFDKAASSLKQGLLDNKNRVIRTRAMYSLAQIYQKQNDLQRALELYKEVIQRNPPYEMAFAARISLATAYDASQGDSKQIVKVLNKMLRDEKNKDFKDKIYFALADIALKENNLPLGIEFLKQSVAATVNDKSQQTTSALRLAAILFDQNNYIVAQAYYDTAVSALPKDYPGYDSIKSKAEVLNDLVFNLTTVQRQDSLMHLAELDSTERNKVIAKLITDFAEKEKQNAEKEASDARNNMLQRNTMGNNQAGSSNSTDWYFYNPNTLGFGFSEFVKKWGRRRLEDNWRISDKQSISQGESEGFLAVGEANTSSQDSAAANLTPRDPAFYLQDIPLTDEQKTQSLEMVMESLNNLGYIYKEQLRDYPRAKESYLSLNERFPESNFRLSSLYALYKIYGAESDTGNANRIRKQILTEFPDSDYAKVILDPQYFVKKAALANESGAFYEQTLQAYNVEEFYRVLLNADRARTRYAEDTALMPRFEFLRAVAAGRLQTVDSLAHGLNQLVRKYPRSPVAARAMIILQNVNKEFNLNLDLPAVAEDTTTAKVETYPYTFDPNTGHLIMIVTNSKSVRTDPLKVRISDFNDRNFKLQKLIIRSLILDNDRTLVTVGNFDNLDSANDYLSALSGNDYVFGSINRNDIGMYNVSLANYPVFYRSKDIEQYKRFWELNTQKTE